MCRMGEKKRGYRAARYSRSPLSSTLESPRNVHAIGGEYSGAFRASSSDATAAAVRRSDLAMVDGGPESVEQRRVKWGDVE